jgi:nitric oxide dioxygenase
MMLSDTSRPVIQATLPVVADHIQEIAGRFYQRLFTEHPELLDGTFNRGNQNDGSQQQALAGSVAAFASALVNTPDHMPESLLSRIAHKHASLGIAPGQYRLVHDTLMWAIGDVLGDAVTPQVAAAWDEVYWLMANTLINQERGLYSARGVAPDRVWREWQVEKKIEETDDVVTFVVKRVHGEGRPDGEVSSLLHRAVNVGDVLTMSLPYGDVVLDDSGRPVVFASAGIGIAPMAGMLSHLVAAGSHLQIMLLHADLDEDAFALRDQVRADIEALPHASIHVWYEHDDAAHPPAAQVFAGTMDLSQVTLPAGAAYYLCGPLPFMQAVRSALITRGIPPADIQYEVFGPDLWLADFE